MHIEWQTSQNYGSFDALFEDFEVKIEEQKFLNSVNEIWLLCDGIYGYVLMITSNQGEEAGDLKIQHVIIV